MATRQAEGAPAAGVLYVITLSSGHAPMPLYVPFVHDLTDFTVFRSRAQVDGREQFQLHVGYFDSEARANEALDVVRRHYPKAQVALPPGSGLGSLDDTLNTEFQMLRNATARVVRPAKPVAAEPSRPPQGQRYAVLLRRSAQPQREPPIPRLPQFRAFSVYAVRVDHAGIPCQEVRLGFFEDVPGARAFAEDIRGHFPAAAVVPVSGREVAHVAGLAGQQAQPERAPAAAPVAAPAIAPAPASAPEPALRASPPLTEPAASLPDAVGRITAIRYDIPQVEDPRGELLTFRWFLNMLAPREPKARIGR